ncbi:MAG TPA: fumarylacetoacetate hydrolase family protein [Anaerolineales bacterium]|nr:fumarylacetoacetate hydrolase family protein [Anaerolineales bacterium]
MRLITDQSDSGPRLGVLDGESVILVPEIDMLTLIELGPVGLDRARAASGPRLPLASLTLLAPIPNPRRNIFCIGHNYAAHVAESLTARGLPVKMPDIPLFFTKATTAINRPYGDIPFDANVSVKIDWEAELAVVIGKAGKNISRQDAMDYVFGYTVLNDVTARDMQNAYGGQFFKGKSLDGACPLGPWIVTRDEIPDPHALTVRSRVNGVLKQEASTSDFIFDIPALLEWLSRGMTLLPGDILSTGTPSGVGFARTPPEFLRPGDVVECEVEGIGMIRNKVVAV